jgi:hypothetical protein
MRTNLKKVVSIVFSVSEDDNGQDSEQAQAKKIAVEVAGLLGREVLPAAQHTINVAINEPLYPFTIPMDTEWFKASVRIAESFYSVELKHRKGERAFVEDALFCVSFKTKDRVMFTKDRVPVASRTLGVLVYRQGFVDDETVDKYLLCDPVRAALGKIDFKPLTRLFLSPIQLEASSKLKDPAACAAQVRVFMELMEAMAIARKPEKPKRTDKR